MMTITTPACPMHSYLTEEVRTTILNQFEEGQAVDVDLVWDPALNVFAGRFLDISASRKNPASHGSRRGLINLCKAKRNRP